MKFLLWDDSPELDLGISLPVGVRKVLNFLQEVLTPKVAKQACLAKTVVAAQDYGRLVDATVLRGTQSTAGKTSR
jgi:hypothetical protein